MGYIDLQGTKRLEIAKGILAHVITADTMTILHVDIEKGALLPEHAHHHEQVVNVIEGELELTVNGTSYSLTPGKVMVLESNVPHSGRAVTACRVIDTFHPIRKDFLGDSFAGYSR